ncbi:hypothetical protein MTBBW1_2100015 [Desulfamplus magnetovallimortis]|uniref:STAS domain-containing protein n=1 Tax=Desulfamplus magnetovallimortis TaxID=1246637 RepID=A0A1W1HCB5_9BACT|nr:hypothetical protein [Desulfamplus magnetovallimortis]SLM30076.1 hypothetical protein MTBBW1_2100015 [Desulfamplus magnetovallimortis]
MRINRDNNTLFLIPDTNLVASQIEQLRDFFLEALTGHPDVSTVILQVDGIDTVDSLGVNLIIGIYRQVTSESKLFKITGAGNKFLKVAAFFHFSALFSISGEEKSR